MSGRLKNQVVLVTGGGQGIGKAIALRLARDGADVAIGDINEENARIVEDEIKNNGFNSFSIKVDVSDSSMVKNMVNAVIDKFKKIDILVANAGVVKILNVEDITEEEWDRTLNINLKGVFLTNQAVIPFMKKQGGGKIINCSSIAGRMGVALESHYCASKFGIIGFSQAIARELAAYNIKVNTICPGVTNTPMNSDIDQQYSKLKNLKPGEQIKKYIHITPLGRLGTPEDIAGAVSFLASPDADFITGHSLGINGGIYMN